MGKEEIVSLLERLIDDINETLSKPTPDSPRTPEPPNGIGRYGG